MLRTILAALEKSWIWVNLKYYLLSELPSNVILYGMYGFCKLNEILLKGGLDIWKFIIIG